MDTCIVCFQSNDDVFECIRTVSSEWNEWNIQRIIEKHLWWWYLRPPSSKETVQWICRECWHKLSSFHSFYLKVEKENKLHHQLSSLVKKNQDQQVTDLNIKMETNNDNISILSENLMSLEKSKRGRKKKTINKQESIDMDALPDIQIKFENEITQLPVCKMRFDADIMVNDLIGSIENEITALNESGREFDADIMVNDEIGYVDCGKRSKGRTKESKQLEQFQNHELNLLISRKNKIKVKKKTKSSTKYAKKYTKIKREKKTKVEKSNLDSNSILTQRKNDKFIADSQFKIFCCICIVSLNNFTDLKIHFRKEHNVSGYATCCNRKFYQRGVLVDHINVHKDPEYFKCLQCNRAFAARRSYELHMEKHNLNDQLQNLSHLLKRKNTCNFCDKTFLRSIELKEHLSTHTGVPNFTCSYCPRTFFRSGVMYKHVRHIHRKEWEEKKIKKKVVTRSKFLNSFNAAQNNTPYPELAILKLGVER